MENQNIKPVLEDGKGGLGDHKASEITPSVSPEKQNAIRHWRVEESKALVADHLKKIKSANENFLSTFNGFLRDVRGAKMVQTDVKMHLKNEDLYSLIPPSINNAQEGLQNLIKNLEHVKEMLSGEVVGEGPATVETAVLQKNLKSMDNAAKRLHDSLSTASVRFSQFNYEDATKKTPEADVKYDVNSLTLAVKAVGVIRGQISKYIIELGMATGQK